MWLVVAVDSSIGWPTKDVPVEYARRHFTLRPESSEYYADVITECGANDDQVEIERELRRFCSMLAWVEDGPVAIVSIAKSSEEVPPRLSRKPKTCLGEFTAPIGLPSDQQLDLMFALYREALSVNSPLFAFFGFFKILNTRLSGDDQKHWITSSLSKLNDEAALERIAELVGTGLDVGTHIYNDLRTAVIHASVKHNIDPDDPIAVSRLSKDLPVMKALAELFIDEYLATVSQP